VSPKEDLVALKDKIGLDYLYLIRIEDRKNIRSEIVLEAFEGRPSAGTRIIEPEELSHMGRSFMRSPLSR